MLKNLFFICLSLNFLNISLLANTPQHQTDPSLNYFYTPFSKESNPAIPATFLASASHTTEPGHVYIEPYFFFISKSGYYNEKWKSHSLPNFYTVNWQTYAWIGITSFLDVWIVPQICYQSTKNQNSTQLGDLPIGIDIQILSDTSGTWHPAIELSIQGTIPIGKYNNLNPKKLGTDGVGAGSAIPSITISSSRLFLLPNGHYLAPKISFNYSFPLSAQVHNLNTYGGAEGTKGTVYPGNIFFCDLEFQYSLNLNWAITCDIFYEHINKTTFKGSRGVTKTGASGIIGGPSSEQISIAPSLQYNLNSNIGFTGSGWISLAGRNANQFAGGVLSLTIYL